MRILKKIALVILVIYIAGALVLIGIPALYTRGVNAFSSDTALSMFLWPYLVGFGLFFYLDQEGYLREIKNLLPKKERPCMPDEVCIPE